jgi:hypothetical protein
MTTEDLANDDYEKFLCEKPKAYSTGMKGITAGMRFCIFFHPLHLLHPCSQFFPSSEAVNNRMRHFFCRHV